PYAVWISEVMLQQTTVAAAAPRIGAFLARWPDAAALAAAPLDDVLAQWAGLGYYARARNLHACAREIVARHGGAIPREEAALLKLPGVGAYTAAAIAAIAFGARTAAVDGNVERVVARLHAVETPMPAAKRELRSLAMALVPADAPGDFAQAMMDLGATVCTPRAPGCPVCPLATDCRARAAGAPERFPVRAAKKARPLRRGAAFVLVRADGAVLLRRRPESGLLGGMSEPPGTPWSADFDPRSAEDFAPCATRWRACGEVRHVFTHFELALDVRVAPAPGDCRPAPGSRFVTPGELETSALPSVMRKALAAAGIAFQAGRASR
ncbi:MAG: A/G-specific adenine glycosylase, partial [Hyphomicrobiales bacterium]|nr:A/G-specific adenine glycosylase [Hyphomicrobiales bacterium]